MVLKPCPRGAVGFHELARDILRPKKKKKHQPRIQIKVVFFQFADEMKS